MAREAVEISEQQDQIDYAECCRGIQSPEPDPVPCRSLLRSGRVDSKGDRARSCRVGRFPLVIRQGGPRSRRSFVFYEAQLAELLRIRGSTAEAKRMAVSALERARAELGQGEASVLQLLATLNDIEIDLGDLAGSRADGH